jgi:hypothetical protein
MIRSILVGLIAFIALGLVIALLGGVGPGEAALMLIVSAVIAVVYYRRNVQS